MPSPVDEQLPTLRLLAGIILCACLSLSIGCLSRPHPQPAQLETDPEPEWLLQAKRGKPGFLLGIGESSVSERLSIDAAMADVNRKIAQIVSGWTTSRDVLITTNDRQQLLSLVIIDATQASTTPWHLIQNQICLRTRTVTRPTSVVRFTAYLLVEIDEVALRVAIRKHQDRMVEINQRIETALSQTELARTQGEFQEAINLLASAATLFHEQGSYTRNDQALRILEGLRMMFSECQLSVTYGWNPTLCRYHLRISAKNGKGKVLRGVPIRLEFGTIGNLSQQTSTSDSNGNCTFNVRPRIGELDGIKVFPDHSTILLPFQLALNGNQLLMAILRELPSAAQPTRIQLADHTQGPPQVDLFLSVQWRRPTGWMQGLSPYIETIHGKVKVQVPATWAGTVRIFHLGYRDAKSEEAQVFSPRGVVFSWTFSKGMFIERQFSLSDTAEAVARAARGFGFYTEHQLVAIFEIRTQNMCDGTEISREVAIALPEIPR